MLFYSFVIVAVLVLLFQVLVRGEGRKRGREIPWGVPIHATLPPFSNARIVSIANKLVLVSILGIMLMGVAIGYMIGARNEAATEAIYVLSALGYLMVSSRSMFVCAAWVFADLEEPSSSSVTSA